MSTYWKRTLFVKSKTAYAKEIGIPGGNVFKIDMASTLKSVIQHIIPEVVSLSTKIDCRIFGCIQNEQISVLCVNLNKTNGKCKIEEDINETLTEKMNETCPCFQTYKICLSQNH